MPRYNPPDAGTWLQEKAALGQVFSRWGVTDWSASANVPDQLANKSYDTYESDVTVVFVKDGKTVTLAMTDYSYPPLSLKVLRLCIDDMRMIERRGVSNVMASAYMQLEGPHAPPDRDPWELFGLRPGASKELIEHTFKLLAKSAHPDNGGSEASMVELNKARDRLLKEIGA